MTDGCSEARYGWGSDFPEFRGAAATVIIGQLEQFLKDASGSQVRAWKDYVPKLQHEVEEVLQEDQDASRYWAILEYELPMESRRPDCLLLAKGAVLVLELKLGPRPEGGRGVDHPAAATAGRGV